jgi:dTDP-4-amino-4,6-dideoxygalactose transaminase
MVARLEELGAAMAGTRHAVAVGNGTDALELAFEVCDLEPGDEVIAPAFTFAATANAVLRAGATVLFADIAEDFTLDVDAAAAAAGERTRAVCPVHLYGLPARLGDILELAGERGLAVIEDAAQSHGAGYGNRPVGSFGIGCFSLYATKNVTAGEGGLITTDDDALADRLRALRNQGMTGRYQYVAVGRNSRMTDLQAAIVIPQLARLSEISATRRANAEQLSAGLADVDGVVLPAERPGTSHVWHQYTVLVPDGVDRDAVVAEMAGRQVHCGVYYPAALNDLTVNRGHPRVVAGETPVARAAARRCISLPVHHGLRPADVDRVVEAFRSALGAALR